jgi:beta-mannosidase
VTVAALRNAEGRTQLSLLNDRTSVRAGELRLRVMDLAGKVLREERRPVTLPPLSSTKVADYTDAELLGGAKAASTIVVFDLSVKGEPAARDVVWFKAAKETAWPDPNLHADLRRNDEGYALTLSAQRVAQAVWIDFGDLDAELSDNALTVLPGEDVTLRVVSKVGLDELRRELTRKSLADVMPAAAR